MFVFIFLLKPPTSDQNVVLDTPSCFMCFYPVQYIFFSVAYRFQQLVATVNRHLPYLPSSFFPYSRPCEHRPSQSHCSRFQSRQSPSGTVCLSDIAGSRHHARNKSPIRVRWNYARLFDYLLYLCCIQIPWQTVRFCRQCCGNAACGTNSETNRHCTKIGMRHMRSGNISA